jgi:hypothetical protein
MRKKYLPKPAEGPGADTPRRVFNSPPLDIHLSRSADQFECLQLNEPELVFGGNHRCVDPRTGLAAYGPYCNADGENTSQLRVGIIGTSEGIEKAELLLHELSAPVEQDGKLDSILHPSFPGLNSRKPFFVDVVAQPSWHRSASAEALQLAMDCSDSTAQFEMFRELYGTQVRAMSQLESPPSVVICAVPAGLEPSVVNAACAQSLPTEIFCDEEIAESEGHQQDKATQAWNLSVRLLYKAGLTPWRLADSAADSCFAGVSFNRETSDASPDAWIAFAHVVTDFGQGFFLKGDTFEWSPKNEAEETPHLDKDHAAKLMSRILQAYRKGVGRSPRKVVVHKTSPFSEAERLGFAESLQGIKQHAMVAVGRKGIFFLRPGREPVFRGAAIPFGEKLGMVYVSGYVPFLKCSSGTQMPEPLEITENWGSLTFGEAAEDLLRLTKLDWNTSAFCADVPVTLAFPDRVRKIFKILGQQDLVLDDRYVAR